MSEGEQIILPDGFKRVEYLQDNGSQWIDTGYVPTNNTGLWVDAQQIVHNNGVPMGSGSDRNSPADGIMPPRWLKSTGNTCGYAWIGWTSWGNIGDGNRFESTLNYLNDKKAILTLKDGRNDTYTGNLGDLNFTPVKSIFLFATNEASYDTQWYGRIYEAKITEGTEVVKHFIPCLDVDNVPCMYDILGTGTIEENTYYNQGTGKFLIPKDFEWDYPHLNNNYNLPAGFKKCVYLQSDGTQWIDTGVIPNNETGLYFNALQLSYGNFIPFGVEESGNTIYPPRFSSKNLCYRWGASVVNMMTWDKAGDLIFHSSLNLYNSKIAKFDSEDTDFEMSITSQEGTYTLPIWLFSINLDGSYNSTYGKWVGRIYRAQITQGDALIHDYVPCLDANGRPCMYDIIGGGTVEDNTYYNQSGGTEFAYCVEHQLPSDFIKLKYLEDNGTQFIDTKIVPNNETGLYVDAQQITHTNTHVMGSGVDTNSTGFGVPRFLKGTANSCGFMWKGWNSYGTIGNGTRFESCLNLYNDRKATLKTAGATERFNNLGELGFTPTVSLYMFRTNYASAGNWNGRIYRAKITQSTELIRDFVPAWDERKTKPCMYDLINNVAYYNDGEGEFLTNRDFEGTYKGYTGLGCIGNRLGTIIDGVVPLGYTRVEFLESTGSQYMNPKLKVQNLNTKIKYYSIYGTTSGKYSGIFMMYNTTSNDSYIHHTYKGGSGDWCGAATTRIRDVEKTIKSYSYTNQYFTSEINLTDGFMQVNDKRIEIEKNQTFVYSDNEPYLFAENIVSGNNKEGSIQSQVQARIYSFEANYNGVEAANLVPAIDDKGRACFYDTIRKMTFYNKASGEDFIVGINSITQAILKLPENGGSIRISIPQTDNNESHEEKIRNNNPNWTITFQYH